jgi:hypothetical protein
VFYSFYNEKSSGKVVFGPVDLLTSGLGKNQGLTEVSILELITLTLRLTWGLLPSMVMNCIGRTHCSVVMTQRSHSAYPIFLAELGGAPGSIFYFVSFNTTFLLGHTGLYETEHPSPKKPTFLFLGLEG